MSRTPREDLGTLSLLAGVLDEITGRLQRGEPLDPQAYYDRHPRLAGPLREALPALLAAHPRNGPPAAPGRLGEYRIERELGRGGMGVVYLARQESLGRPVALKLLSPQASADGRFLARFRREAAAAARLHHTNIVPVFGVGEDGGVHFYAMQYIDGRGLDQAVRERAGQAPPDEGWCRRAAGWAAQAADALAYAHERGVLHRDVKPANLLLDEAGKVWVADFGLARTDEDTQLTGTGDVVGTLRYLAPERLGGVADARGDVYSLGLTLYELLTLRPAYDADDRAELVRQITDADPPAPRRRSAAVPRDLETVVLKATAREPARRYATAAELAADLRRFLGGRAVTARRVGLAESGWRWCKRYPAVAALLLAVLIGAAASGWQAHRATRQARRAEVNFEKARAAVDGCYVAVTESPALQEPGMEAARKVLLETALPFYRDFLREYGDDPRLHGEVARIHYRVGVIQQTVGALPEAREAFEEARAMFARLGKGVEVARCDHALAGCARDRSDFAEAEAVYRRCLELRESLGDEHPDPAEHVHELAEAREGLVSVLVNNGQLRQAEPLLDESVRQREKLRRERPEHKGNRLALGAAYQALARVYNDTRRKAPAAEADRKAVAAVEALHKEEPANPAYREKLANAWSGLGANLFNNGAGNPACGEPYLQALRLYEELGREYPRQRRYLRAVVRTCNNLGLHSMFLDMSKVESWYTRALDAAERLRRLAPGDPDVQAALAKIHSDRGLWRDRQGEPARAAADFRQAVALIEPIARAAPAVSEWRLRLTDGRINLASLLGRQGHPKEALELLGQTIADMEGLVRAEPKHLHGLRRLCISHASRAEIHSEANRHQEALADWDRALEISEKDAPGGDYQGRQLGRFEALGRAGKHAEATAGAEQIPPGLNPRGLRILAARVFAAAAASARADTSVSEAERARLLGSYGQRAVEILKEARAAGSFSGLGTRRERLSLRADPVWGPLRERTDFRKLVDEVDPPPGR